MLSPQQLQSFKSAGNPTVPTSQPMDDSSFNSWLGGSTDSSAPATKDTNTVDKPWLPMEDGTESPFGNVLKGITKGSGEDIAGAVGASSYIDNAKKVGQADQDAVTMMVNKRNEAQKSGDTATYNHFQNMIKNYKTVNGESVTDLFPALNKSTEQVVGDFGNLALGLTAGGGLEAGVKGASEAIAEKSLSGAVASGAKVGATYGGVGGAANAMQEDKPIHDVLGEGFKGAVEGALAGAATGGVIHSASGALSEDASKAASAIKEKIAPSETPEQITGKILQGDIKDVPHGKSALEKLDTTGVKTYKDLESKASDKISTLSKAQDHLLEADGNTYKIQQLATKVGDKEAAHNFVIDSLNQLKTFYEKTNDVANLSKVTDYLGKIDPVKGDGLTLKEVNDIARMHGSDLNAYNASGELASGLSKQAAENTRQGLKSTIRNLLPGGASKALDEEISHLYTVKSLAHDMAEKVNTASQKLQKPSLLQKAGALAGKAVKGVGVGDFAREIGFGKFNPESLSPVELEKQLPKLLKKLKGQ